MTGNVGSFQFSRLAAADEYPTTQIYSITFQSQLAPLRIDLALLARSRLPPDRSDGFRYLELGCGLGANLVALAALYPEGKFLGVDMMPEHVAWARQLAREAKIANVEFEENDFASFAARDSQGELFHYVVAHGVYSWISDEKRRHLREILSKSVCAGGAVYISCNALPGWASANPIRRIFRDVVGSLGGQHSIAEARAAIESFVMTYKVSSTRQWWQRLSAQSDAYLMHELGAAHADALWSVELHSEMAEAQLDYVGPASLTEHFDSLTLDAAALARIEHAMSLGYGTTAKDVALGR